MSTARVHSFESFGTVDGPGIRFVIFFQGCHLTCKYCHNRDLWDMKGGQLYTAKELFNKVKSFIPFFKSSNGGVTLSGGDPILQPEIAYEFFRLCKKAGIHTALDTSGVTEITPKIEKLLSCTDLVLLDIKHSDNKKHKELTGVDNRLVFQFAEYLHQKSIPMWIRHVVIPNVTDTIEDCTKLVSFLKKINNIEKIELLPYHKLGEYKWELLNETYKLKDAEPPTAEKMNQLKELFANEGLKVSIPER